MDIAEVLRLADNLAFSHTGKHLDDVQEAVVKGVCKGHTYTKIGEECYRSEARVRDVAYKLWKILSESLGEDINKANFCSTLERLNSTLSQIIIQNHNHNSHFHFCSRSNQSPNNHTKNDANIGQLLPYHNLQQSPKVTKFYGRNSELATLAQWLDNPHTRLISVLGMTGIGKSTLVKHLINTHPLPFDAIIWKNLKLSPSLDDIFLEILTKLEPEHPLKNTESLLNQVLKLFTQKRCLIILDYLQDIFTPQQLVGHYQPAYQNYQTFLKAITEMEHQSCIILISQEKCQEMVSLDTEIYPSYCLELSGLDEIDIPWERVNNDMDKSWSQLINLYEGHPQFLQYIRALIQDIFAGDVAEFLQENYLILTPEIKSYFNSIWARLSEIEQNILICLSKKNKPLLREEIKESLSLSSTDAVNGLQSLTRRFLLKSLSGQKLFALSPIWREFLIIIETPRGI